MRTDDHEATFETMRVRWSLYRDAALSEFSYDELDRVLAPLLEAEFHA
jgi:hypothetical protein